MSIGQKVYKIQETGLTPLGVFISRACMTLMVRGSPRLPGRFGARKARIFARNSSVAVRFFRWRARGIFTLTWPIIGA